MRTYVTFTGNQTHKIGGEDINSDCIAVINCHNAAEGRELAHQIFGDEFFLALPSYAFPGAVLPDYPRGLIEVN